MPHTLPILNLCGRPFVSDGSAIVYRLRSQRCWALFGLLALTPGVWHDRARLAASLWPDAQSHRALHNLRQTLQYIRAGVPASAAWLEVDASAIRLKPEAVEVRVHPEPGEPGEFLEGLADEWAVGARHTFTPWEHAPANVDPDLSRMESSTQRAALVGLTPTWIALGALQNGLFMIAQLRADPRYLNDVELGICEAELFLYAHRLDHARAALARLEPHIAAATGSLRARHLVATAMCDVRQGLNTAGIRGASEGYRLALRCGDLVSAKRATVVINAAYPAGDNIWSERGRRLCAKEANDPWNPVIEFLALRADLGAGKPLDTIRARAAVKAIEASGTPGLNGITMARIGRLLEQAGEVAQAKDLYIRSAELLKRTDLLRELAEAKTYLGDLLRHGGDPAGSLAAHLEAVVLRRPLRDPMALATSLRGAGMAAQALGHDFQARTYLREALDLFEVSGFELGAALSAVPLARLLGTHGRREQAASLMRAALTTFDSIPEARRKLEIPTDLQDLDAVRAELSMLEFERPGP